MENGEWGIGNGELSYRLPRIQTTITLKRGSLELRYAWGYDLSGTDCVGASSPERGAKGFALLGGSRFFIPHSPFPISNYSMVNYTAREKRCQPSRKL